MEVNDFVSDSSSCSFTIGILKGEDLTKDYIFQAAGVYKKEDKQLYSNWADELLIKGKKDRKTAMGIFPETPYDDCDYYCGEYHTNDTGALPPAIQMSSSCQFERQGFCEKVVRFAHFMNH